MDDLFGDLLHKTDQLSALQMGMRAILVFLLTIVLIRLSGRRSIGLRSPLDTVITLLLGATLSRAIVGASPFTGVALASLVIVLLHRLVAWSCAHNKLISRLLNGEQKVLYQNGQLNHDNMDTMMISEQDLQEAVRRTGHVDSLSEVQKAVMERNGEISVVKK